jgi:hypothetical protein
MLQSLPVLQVVEIEELNANISEQPPVVSALLSIQLEASG